MDGAVSRLRSRDGVLDSIDWKEQPTAFAAGLIARDLAPIFQPLDRGGREAGAAAELSLGQVPRAEEVRGVGGRERVVRHLDESRRPGRGLALSSMAAKANDGRQSGSLCSEAYLRRQASGSQRPVQTQPFVNITEVATQRFGRHVEIVGEAMADRGERGPGHGVRVTRVQYPQ